MVWFFSFFTLRWSLVRLERRPVSDSPTKASENRVAFDYIKSSHFRVLKDARKKLQYVAYGLELSRQLSRQHALPESGYS